MRLLIALLLCALAAPAQALTPAETEAFRHDLDLLARELPRRHASLFHDTSQAGYEAAVAALRTRLPELSRPVAIAEMARIVALARDGHTALFLLPFPGATAIPGITQLPVQLYAFPDGLRIVAITRTQATALGARVAKIGGVPADEALARVAALLPRDNDMGTRDLGPFYLALPAALEAAGLTTEYTLDDGRVLRLTPEAAPDAGWATQLVTLPGARTSWVSALDGAPQASWLAKADVPWWSETQPDGTVYAQVNLMRETPQARFAAFAETLLASVPKTGAPRLVIDLRLNRGGNGELVWPLVYAIIRHDVVNQPGRLFVLTGRRTFSAAQLAANALEKHTKAVFVGEPPGSAPCHWGELGRLELPETKLTVFHSMLRFSADPGDRRPWIPPHVAAELTYADLGAGRDPALEATRHYAPLPRAAEVMQEKLAQHDTKGAVAALRALAAAHRNPWRRLFEKDLNDLGYGLLEEKCGDDAIAVLALAAELYPDSANAWDSLGEAYLMKGVRHRAAYSYARSLRLDPKNGGAENALADILGDR